MRFEVESAFFIQEILENTPKDFALKENILWSTVNHIEYQ
jgi:hypothetical protein